MPLCSLKIHIKERRYICIESKMLRYFFIATMFVYQVTARRLLMDPLIMLGADRDEYGCIGSAGYSWCNITEKCVSANELCIPLPPF